MSIQGIHHVTIIGVGLLGGSTGLAIKALGGGIRVAGVGRRAGSLRAALKIGAIDSAHMDVAQAVGPSDLVILATPVGAFEHCLRAIRPHLKKGAVVTDVGSTKGAVVRLASRVLGPGGPFVGSHPMAGSERRGPAFARADLLAGATCILTPTAQTPPASVRRVEAFWRALGMRTLRMSPQAHDRAVAEISHLPQALASLLMLLPKAGHLKIAAGGFRDMTRLAGSDAQMWRDIFLTNPAAILDVMDRFDRSLARLRELVKRGDSRGLEKFFVAAKSRRSKTVARKHQEV
jgi:prephenate dehydrogenase